MTRHSWIGGSAAAAAAACWLSGSAQAHHSFAMYDLGKSYVMTGVVTRVDPNPNHLQLFFAPLNDARDQVVKDAKGQPIVWAVEKPQAAPRAKVSRSTTFRAVRSSASACTRTATAFRPAGAARAACLSAPPIRRPHPASTATR